jgi:hypothetical protein
MSKVAIVVDRAFGERLSKLSRSCHVWVVESPVNTPVIRDVWQDTSAAADRLSMRSGVTSFKDNAELSADEICVAIVAVVDEHHGEPWSDSPWSEIEVFGAPLTPALRSAFEDVGGASFESTTDGFVCRHARE